MLSQLPQVSRLRDGYATASTVPCWLVPGGGGGREGRGISLTERSDLPNSFSGTLWFPIKACLLQGCVRAQATGTPVLFQSYLRPTVETEPQSMCCELFRCV